MTQITQIVDDLPIVGDLRDDPDTFVANSDKLMTALPTMVTQFKGAVAQINVVVGEINVSAAAVTLSAGAAATSETNAATQAQIAVAAAASAVNAPGTSSTSTTSLALTPGAKNLMVAANKDFPRGSSVKIAYNTDVSKWMIGSVDSYNVATGAMLVLVDANDINGTGTFTDWTVSVSGHRGAPAAIPTPALPIGAVAAFHGQTTNPVILADGTTWLRSGTIALSSLYPNAVKNMVAESGGDIGAASSALLYVNGLWIICLPTYISTSTDMKAWTRHYHAMGAAPSNVVYDGSHYLFAVGAKAYRSLDFSSFSYHMTLPASFAVIKRVNGVLFGLRYADTLYTSTDGTTWTSRALPTNSNWSDIVWAGPHYVLVSSNSDTCVVSSDGLTWANAGTLGIGGATAIAMNVGGRLVVAKGTAFAYSDISGTSWNVGAFATMTATSSYKNIVWTGTKFVVAANGGAGIALATSANGAVWAEIVDTAVGGQPGDAGIHGQGGHLLSNENGIVVMASYSFRYVSSDHGLNWLALNRLAPTLQHKIAGNGNKAVQVIKDTARIALLERSGNSLAFTSRYVSVPTLTSLQYVACSGTAWIVCHNSGGNVVRSTDGLNWTVIDAGFWGTAANDRLHIVAGVPNCFISITGRRSVDDGVTWGALAIPASVNSITAKGNLFVALTGSSTYHTSSDNGTTWTQRTAPASVEILFDGNYWMIPVADSSSPTGAYLHVSSDGINWVTRAAPSDINPANFNAAAASVGNLGHCLIMGSNTSYPLMNLMTMDGGVTWKFHYSLTLTGASNYQTLWGGYDSSWVSLNTDYCGLQVRRHLFNTDNGEYGSSPTYYQRVA